MVQIRSIYSMGSSRLSLIFSRRKKLRMMYQPRMNPLTNKTEYHRSSMPPRWKMTGSIFQLTTKYSIDRKDSKNNAEQRTVGPKMKDFKNISNTTVNRCNFCSKFATHYCWLVCKQKN